MQSPNDKINNGIKSLSQDIEIVFKAVATEVAGLTINPPLPASVKSRHRTGFLMDGVLRLSYAPYTESRGKVIEVYFGHYEQGGGFRIDLPCITDSKQPSHVLRVRSPDHTDIKNWEIDISAASHNNDLRMLLANRYGGSRINQKSTEPIVKVTAVADVILHSLLGAAAPNSAHKVADHLLYPAKRPILQPVAAVVVSTLSA